MGLGHCVESILNKNQSIIPKNMNFNFVNWLGRKSEDHDHSLQN
jgi:hypothetical protein